MKVDAQFPKEQLKRFNEHYQPSLKQQAREANANAAGWFAMVMEVAPGSALCTLHEIEKVGEQMIANAPFQEIAEEIRALIATDPGGMLRVIMFYEPPTKTHRMGIARLRMQLGDGAMA